MENRNEDDVERLLENSSSYSREEFPEGERGIQTDFQRHKYMELKGNGQTKRIQQKEKLSTEQFDPS